MLTVQCPHCKKPVVWSKGSKFRPFCSERCRLIDLGAWADESYSIPTAEQPTDEISDLPPTQNHDENSDDDES